MWDVTLTRTTYLNIVADLVHPFLVVVFPNGNDLFQPQNTCHTAKVVQGKEKERFEEHDNVFRMLTWPANYFLVSDNITHGQGSFGLHSLMGQSCFYSTREPYTVYRRWL